MPKIGQAVKKHVRDAIMSGALISGQRLVVDDLATQLGVSTMPVREAFAALSQEGLLEELPRRGYRVATLSRRDIEDIFQVYSFVAGVLAHRATELMTPKVIQHLQHTIDKVNQIIARGDSERNRSQIEFFNYSFHRSVNELVTSPRLHAYLESSSQYVPRHLYATIPTWTSLTVHEHPAILAAFEGRDAKRTRRLVEEHVLHAGQQIVENLELRRFFEGERQATISTDGIS
jgi:DNA-binding GntR family transcriptional regulator